jgi:hypothetical protein
MPDEGIGAMDSDLSPVYTASEEGALARGVTRQTVNEITGFYRSRLEHFSNMPMNCTDCRFLRGTYCNHWRDTVPEDTKPAGCDDWQWSGVPF